MTDTDTPARRRQVATEAREITNRTERDALLAEIRAALVGYYGDPITVRPGADWGEVRDTERARHRQADSLRTLINRAVDGGISHRQISSATQWPGRHILGWIDDPAVRRHAYEAELHHLEREMTLVRQARSREAFVRLTRGETKTALAAEFGVTRPTLDKWLSDASL